MHRLGLLLYFQIRYSSFLYSNGLPGVYVELLATGAFTTALLR